MQNHYRQTEIELHHFKTIRKFIIIIIIMLSLPFNVKSLEVKNTGLSDSDVEGIVWIDEKRIKITNAVDCVFDDGQGGTTVGRITEFEWSFTKRDFLYDPYLLITLSPTEMKTFT